MEYEKWIIACAAWNNVTPKQMFDACNADAPARSGPRMPEGSRKAWDRVFTAIADYERRMGGVPPQREEAP